MTLHKRWRSASTVGLALAVVFLASACADPSTSSGNEQVVSIEGFRDKLYSSYGELIEDSDVVVEARAVESAEIKGQLAGLPGTVAQLEVVNSFSYEGLRAHTDELNVLKPGDKFFVLQYGTESIEGPAPLLRPGSSYLLFLSRSVISDSQAQEFFVTGSSAGIFELIDGQFVSRSVDGDTIDQAIGREELERLGDR